MNEKKNEKMDEQREVSAAVTKSRKICLTKIPIYMPKVQKQPKTKQEKNETNGRTKGLFAAAKLCMLWVVGRGWVGALPRG